MQKFTVEIKQEQADFLQRLGNEVDSKVFLIDRMFANHASDTDTTMFDSIPFKHYMEEYEKARFAWETAKTEFQSGYLDSIVQKLTKKDKVNYSWKIEDFHSLQCEVTVLE